MEMNIRKHLNRLKDFIGAVTRNVIEDQVFSRGTSLAFSTTMALVPLTMVVFSLGGFNKLSRRILDALGQVLLPDSSDEIVRAFNTFTTNASSLGTWSTLLFILAAIMLLNAIENHLNTIFRVRHSTGFLGRARMYFTTLALTAFVFASGFGPLTGILETWERVPVLGKKTIGFALSLLGTMGGMMALFSSLSAARIRLRSALAGGFTGAVIFQAAKFFFALWMQRSVRNSIIYGSLVFIPIFLLWLAVAWIVFLISAEITFVIQNQSGLQTNRSYDTPALEIETGWKLFLELSNDFHLGRKPAGIRELAGRLGIDETRASCIIHRLSQAQLIRTVTGSPPGYVPAAPPDNLPAAEIFSLISGWNADASQDSRTAAAQLVCQSIHSALGERTIRSFLPEEIPQNE